MKQLKNVLYNGEDANRELTELCDCYAKLKEIPEEERKRLNYELDLIKKWGIAKVFLFGYDLSLSEGFGTTLVIEGNSYVNYLLGISNINPVKYNLPFERLFNEYRICLLSYCFYVEKSRKGKMLKRLYEKYGKSTIVRASDNKCMYFISNNPFESKFIKESIIVANQNEEAYEETISCLTCEELNKLNYYNFSILEAEDISSSGEDEFTEDIIYEKAKELFSYKIPDTPSFTEISDVNEILKDTEFKLIYQEQLMEIFNKICGFDMAKADYLRREIAKAKRGTTQEVKEILSNKYGEKGQTLFDYLIKVGRYTVSKAYVLANLHVLIEY